jgi:hypothetical protein
MEEKPPIAAPKASPTILTLLLKNTDCLQTVDVAIKVAAQAQEFFSPPNWH